MDGSVLGGIGKAIALARDLLTLNASNESARKIRDLLAELQRANLEKVAADACLAEANSELARLKRALHEMEGYQECQIGPGAFVLAKPPADPGSGVAQQPYLCCHCHQDGRKSILQFQTYSQGMQVMACPRCQATVRFPGGPSQEVRTAGRSNLDFTGY